jgi:hypothetical protein
MRMSEPASTVERHYTMREAVARFFPGGQLTVSSLRREMLRGRLHATMPAGKILVTESDIAEMLKKCAVKGRPDSYSRSAHASKAGAKASPANALFGLSETERIAKAQAAANMIGAQQALSVYIALKYQPPTGLGPLLPIDDVMAAYLSFTRSLGG